MTNRQPVWAKLAARLLATLTKAQFATLDTQWTSTTYIGTSVFCNDPGDATKCKKDGSAYWGYINSLGTAAY